MSEIKFLFFNNEKNLVETAQQGRIKALSLSSYKEPDKRWQDYYLSLPRYFAVFLNPEKSEVLAEKEVKIALNHGTDKKEVVRKDLDIPKYYSLLEKAVVNSPILPKIYGFNEPTEIYDFDVEKAKTILEEAGFKDEDGDGVREKSIEKTPSFRFKRDLKLKKTGTEVEELQKCLAKFPDIYPDGEITSYFGEKTELAVIKFQEKYAEEILEPWGFDSGTGLVSKTTREKLNEICFEDPIETLALRFSLITVDQPQLIKIAEELKKQWKLLGVDLEIKKFPISQLEQDFIKPRDYEALLFGEVLGAIPDLLPFWHSSQKRDPGLNLSLYENDETDRLLEEIRSSSDSQIRTEKLLLFQDALIKDAPAVFLYCPDYIYLVLKEIKGINIKKIIDPSKRFSGIEKWYIKTKRVWR